MIHIIIGTKAQFIKMLPVIKGLEERGVNYNLINLGQHGGTVKHLAAQFQVKVFKFQVGDDKDVVTLSGMFKWVVGHLINIAFMRNYLKEKIYKGQNGIALIHGDTLSTLVGLLMAKRAGLKVAHIESGLRSWSYLNPFPEELIRIICMRFSDYLFAPSDDAVENLKKMGLKGKIINTGGNTGLDAVRMVLHGAEVGAYDHVPSNPYVLVSIHRFENLYSKKRFQLILDTVDEVSKKFNILFVMHGPTERRLKKARVRSQESGGITCLSLQGYPAFLQLIKDSEFVITDGGSVQEECFYLGKPCLIMRKRTERRDGIGKNAVIGEFNRSTIEGFIRDYQNYNNSKLYPKNVPTDILIDEVLRL